MDLYITEKPSVAAALSGYLNEHRGANFSRKKTFFFDPESNAVITWCIGHLLYTCPPEKHNPDWKSWKMETLPMLPVEIKKVPYADKKEQYETVTELARTASRIIHAGDPDREGQLLVDELLTENVKGKVDRLLLNALDDDSMAKAFTQIQPNKNFVGLFNAGECRSTIDWLIGMNLTRYYTLKARAGGYDTVMKVGRVKAPTLSLIVEREKEILGFKKETYHNIYAVFMLDNVQVKALMQPKERIKSLEEAKKIIRDIVGAALEVSNIEVKQHKKEITELYSLDTLQIEADKVLGFSASKTLELLQSLYEKKHVSYPRSDCKHLPESQFADAEKIIKEIYTKNPMGVPIPEVRNMPKVFNDKKVTAHHGIIPTAKVPYNEELEPEQWILYLLVVKKYLGAFFPAYEYTTQKVSLTYKDYIFSFGTKAVTQDGWQVLYRDFKRDEEDNPVEFEIGTPIMEKQTFPIEDLAIQEAVTKPQKRYTEGSLIAAMNNVKGETEEATAKLRDIKGIGTPATRASIIQELIDSKLLQKNKKILQPTDSGMQLISVLPDEIKKADYTAKVEELLSSLEAGATTKKAVITDVADYISKIIAGSSPADVIENRSYPCPKCKAGYLSVKHYKDKDTGKINEYAKCNNQDCAQILPSKNGKPHVVYCPKCKKGLMLSKRNKDKNSVFFGCSTFPMCKNTMNADDFKKMKSKPPSLL